MGKSDPWIGRVEAVDAEILRDRRQTNGVLGKSANIKLKLKLIVEEAAPDDEAAARIKAIEYFHIEPALQFRVVATKLDKVKERA